VWSELAKLTVPLIYLSLFGVFALAIVKGGRAEREGAILYIALWLATMLVPKTEGSQNFVYIVLLADAAAAFGFLFLAIRYSNLWIAGAMIAQGICFGAHAFRLEDDVATPMWRGMNIYLMVMNITSALVIWLLLFGTLSSWRRRVRDRKAIKKSVLVPATAEPPGAPGLRGPGYSAA
jgi:hypothetical protein